MADQCVMGVHAVWPTQLSNRMSNVQLHPSFWTRALFAEPSNGTGVLRDVGKMGALVVEPSHSAVNNGGLVPTMMIANLFTASFNDSHAFGQAASTLAEVSVWSEWSDIFFS
jgi:hypothetical protein